MIAGLRHPRYTCAFKLRYNAMLFIEHPTPLRWDAGRALFAQRELNAMYRYLDTETAYEYPASLDNDLPALALLHLFIAEALLSENEAAAKGEP